MKFIRLDKWEDMIRRSIIAAKKQVANYNIRIAQTLIDDEEEDAPQNIRNHYVPMPIFKKKMDELLNNSGDKRLIGEIAKRMEYISSITDPSEKLRVAKDTLYNNESVMNEIGNIVLLGAYEKTQNKDDIDTGLFNLFKDPNVILNRIVRYDKSKIADPINWLMTLGFWAARQTGTAKKRKNKEILESEMDGNGILGSSGDGEIHLSQLLKLIKKIEELYQSKQIPPANLMKAKLQYTELSNRYDDITNTDRKKIEQLMLADSNVSPENFSGFDNDALIRQQVSENMSSDTEQLIPHMLSMLQTADKPEYKPFRDQYNLGSLMVKELRNTITNPDTLFNPNKRNKDGRYDVGAIYAHILTQTLLEVMSSYLTSKSTEFSEEYSPSNIKKAYSEFIRILVDKIKKDNHMSVSDKKGFSARAVNIKMDQFRQMFSVVEANGLVHGAANQIRTEYPEFNNLPWAELTDDNLMAIAKYIADKYYGDNTRSQRVYKDVSNSLAYRPSKVKTNSPEEKLNIIYNYLIPLRNKAKMMANNSGLRKKDLPEPLYRLPADDKLWQYGGKPTRSKFKNVEELVAAPQYQGAVAPSSMPYQMGNNYITRDTLMKQQGHSSPTMDPMLTVVEDNIMPKKQLTPTGIYASSNNMIKIAEALDEKGLYKESDVVTEIMSRLAYFGGLNNLNIPMKNRVIPWGDMDKEFEEVDQWRQEFPRYRTKDYKPDDASDIEDAKGSLTDMNAGVGPDSGISLFVDDPKSAGMEGLDKFKFDNRDENGKGYPKYSPN